VQGARCKVQGARCKVHGARCKVQGARCKVQGARCKVQGARCKQGQGGTFLLFRVPGVRSRLQRGVVIYNQVALCILQLPSPKRFVNGGSFRSWLDLVIVDGDVCGQGNKLGLLGY
jgi:hypothetical protein